MLGWENPFLQPKNQKTTKKPKHNKKTKTKKQQQKNHKQKTFTKATKKELVSFFLLLPYSRPLLGFHTTDHILSEILNSLHYFFWRINLDRPRDKKQNAQWIPTLNSSLLLWTQHKKRKKESHTSYSIYIAFTQ